MEIQNSLSFVAYYTMLGRSEWKELWVTEKKLKKKNIEKNLIINS